MAKSFKNWLALREMDSQGVASQWIANAPAESVHNEQAVAEWASRHALADIAEELLGIVALGREVYNPVYEEHIDGNLLKDDTGHLGEGMGVLAWPRPARFAFIMEGRNTGDILVRHPPMLFDREMEILLHSVIVHELRHAHDWATGNHDRTQPSPSDLLRVDMELYARHVMEARGYADQLTYLLGRLEGQADKVMDALSRPGSGMELDVRLRPVARAFVQHYAKDRQVLEDGRWLAPAVAAALMLPVDAGQHPDESTPAPRQPAQVRLYQAQEQWIYQAASVANRMASLFSARHFMRGNPLIL